MKTSTEYETLPSMTVELTQSAQTSTMKTAIILIPTPTNELPTSLLTTNENLDGTPHPREVVAWLLVMLLTILSLVLLTIVVYITVLGAHKKTKAGNDHIQDPEEELEDNLCYEASHSQVQTSSENELNDNGYCEASEVQTTLHRNATPELKENSCNGASNAQPSVCKVIDNPCYISTEAKRTSENLYESIKIEHFYTYAQQ